MTSMAWFDYYDRNWLPRATRHAHALAKRIDALGNVFYTGCGFHYDKERRITNILALLQELSESSTQDWTLYTVARVGLQVLSEEVHSAELSTSQFN